MKITVIKNIFYLVLFALAIFCYLALSLNLLNCKIETNNIVIPILIMACGLICLLMIFFLSYPLLIRQPDKETIENKNIIHNSDPESFHLQRKYIPPEEAAAALVNDINDLTDIKSVAEKILGNVAKKFDVVHGLFFLLHKRTGEYRPVAKYAYASENEPSSFFKSEGISGQAVADQEIVIIKDIPDQYFTVLSALGKAKPSFLYIIPVISGKTVIAVIEISTFNEIDQYGLSIINNLSKDKGKLITKTFSGMKN